MKDEPRGFSGLRSLKSDVEKTHQAGESVHSEAVNQPHGKSFQPYDNTRDDGLLRKIIGWFFGLVTAAVAFVVYLVGSIVVRLLPLGILLGIVFWFVHSKDQEKADAIQPFAQYIDQFLVKKGTYESPPKVDGKLLPIDLNTREVDKSFFHLDELYRASSPQEVAFVVGISCGENVVGEYTDGAKAKRIYCDAELVDINSGKWYSLGRFMGSEPPSKKKGGGSKSGSRPTRDIFEKVKKLSHYEIQ